ncbi:MAG TPA: hypothetical protein VGN88_04260, partial [Phycisphaerae bacterium]
MADIEAPYYPIIYVRGYAGSQTDVEDTTADPFNGFNLGSTRLRQQWDGKCTRYFFESPIIRLMKDHGYQDIYEGGAELAFPPGIPAKSLIIFRFYDRTSLELGDGTRLSITDAAGELS